MTDGTLTRDDPRDTTVTSTGVLIVGAGFSGMGMAIALRREGRDDFLILEKSEAVGGTWRDNTYPGCACDIPSNLYSYSFELNPEWTTTFPRQPEIDAYLRRCGDKYQLSARTRFGADVVTLVFDEQTSCWDVTTRRGDRYRAPAVVLGIGPLHRPSFPSIPGRERFTGEVFHSSRWNHDVELAGARVAVIGTGASAVQFVPAIADSVGHLSVFQRTPPWIMPKRDRRVSPMVRRLYRRYPAIQRLRRDLLYWSLESRALGFSVNPRLLRAAQLVARRHLARQVPDPETRRALTPSYTMGCKRVLLSNDYYPALSRPNVRLVTAPISEIRNRSIVTADGEEHPVDVIIYGTGFHVTDAFDQLRVVGPGGRTLGEAWADGMRAYLGTSIAGFPNLFLVIGPNTGLGHNSMVFMIESGVRHVVQALKLRDSQAASSIAVRPEAEDAFNTRLQRGLERAVWSVGGCRSWYLSEDGRNRTLWPGFTVTYWWRTRRLRRGDFELG